MISIASTREGTASLPQAGGPDPRLLRLTGLLGMVGALVWIAGISLEYPRHLQPPGSGALFVFDQLLFLVAELGYVAAILGVIASRGAGSGWFARSATGLFLAGQVALVTGLVLGLVIDRSVGDVFLPIGGLGSLVGSLLVGIAVIRAQRWTGWRRFAPLAFALYVLLVMMVPLAVLNREPTYFTEFFWSVVWFVLSLALWSEAAAGHRPLPATA